VGWVEVEVEVEVEGAGNGEREMVTIPSEGNDEELTERVQVSGFEVDWMDPVP